MVAVLCSDGKRDGVHFESNGLLDSPLKKIGRDCYYQIRKKC